MENDHSSAAADVGSPDNAIKADIDPPTISLPIPQDTDYSDDSEDEQDDETEYKVEKLSGAVTTDLTRDLSVAWKALFKVSNMEWFSPDLVPVTEGRPSCTINFRMPHHQRATIVLQVSMPMEMNAKINPAQLRTHVVTFAFPSINVSKFAYIDLEEAAIALLRPKDAEGFAGFAGNPYPLGMASVTAKGVCISGATVPALAQSGLQDKIKELIAHVRQAMKAEQPQVLFQFLIRCRDDVTTNVAAAFQNVLTAQAANDPALAWIANSPNANALTMGNLVPQLDRPVIPVQPAETVFADKMSYTIPHTYGTVFDEEYQKIIIDELKAMDFNMKLLETPIGINPADEIDPTHPQILTTARTYFAFIDFNDKDVVRPEVGDSVRVQIIDEAWSAAHGIQANEGDEEEEEGSARGNNNDLTEEEQVRRDREHLDTAELGNEDNIDVLDDDDPLQHAKDPLSWFATCVDPIPVTPSGHCTLLLERRRDPLFEGPRHLRPFVDIPLPTANIRAASTDAELDTMVADAQSVPVKVSMKYNNQSLKDQVRCNDELWRSNSAQQQRIRNSLLAQDTQNSLKSVNVHALKGRSTVDFTHDLNAAQKACHASLVATPEITLIHGPFGTGKTSLLLKVVAETISNPAKKKRVLYTVESNAAVDDITLRLANLCKLNGLGSKKIIRAHSLKGEKSEVYKYYDELLPYEDRYQISDALVAEFATVAYLAELTEKNRRIRARGDPRRVLAHMSLAQAMYDTLETETAPNLVNLRAGLQEYGIDGFAGTLSEQRTEIKLALNELMARTIASADVIVCTLAAASKVNLATNFQPDIVILDEAARCTEFKTNILFGLYNPVVFILAADHKQIRPYVISADQAHEKNNNPYTNPFQNFTKLSAFERFILVGFKHSLLTIQHRCTGDIHPWLSKTYYHGQVTKALPSLKQQEKIRNMRNLAQDTFYTKVPTNRYAVMIENSRHNKAKGETSSYNDAEIVNIMEDLHTLRNDERCAGFTFLITSFYKAQVNRLRVLCHDLPGVTVVDGNEALSPVTCATVESVQGAEFDVVLISFTHTKNPTFLGEPHRFLVALSRARYLLGIYTNWQLAQGRTTADNYYVKSLFQDLKINEHIIDRSCERPERPDNRTCHNCKQVGHTGANCTQPRPISCARCREMGDTDNMMGHLARDCPHYERSLASTTCNNCKQKGHKKQNCPDVTCSRCHHLGHTVYICPVPVVCSRCHSEGHIARVCTVVITRAFLADLATRRTPVPDPAALAETATTENTTAVASLGNAGAWNTGTGNTTTENTTAAASWGNAGAWNTGTGNTTTENTTAAASWGNAGAWNTGSGNSTATEGKAGTTTSPPVRSKPIPTDGEDVKAWETPARFVKKETQKW